MRKFPRTARCLLPLLVVAGLVSACQQQAAPDAGDAPDAAPAQADANDAPAAADAPAAVRTAFEKFLAAKSYRARMGDASGGVPATTMEFVAPDRYRIKMGADMEQVRIGSDLYTTMGGKTTHTQAEAGMASPRDGTKIVLDALATAKVEALGEETVGDESAKVYRIATTQPAPGETKVWISSDSGLPLKSEAKAEGVPTTMMVEYSDYDDTSISIEPPKAD